MRTDLPNDKASNFNARLRETVMTYLGKQGDPLDRGVTLRDLVESGIVELSGSKIGSGPVPLTPGEALGPVVDDFTPPPAPSGFTATAGLATIIVQHDNPTYNWGNGHLRTRLYGKIRNVGDPVPTFNDAAEIAQFTGQVYAYPTALGTTWHLWVKWETNNAVLGQPSGGTNGLVVQTGLVGSSDLSDAIITAAKIADGSINLGGTKITGLLANANMAVITDATKIADSLIGNTKLANLAVDAAKLANSSVTSTKIANLAVGTAAIQTGAITTALIANAAIGSAQIADAAITSAKIGTAAIGSAAIQDLAVTNAKIANLAIDDAKIASLSAAKITAGTIAADRLDANTITSKVLSVDWAKITNADITSAQIRDAAITTAKIADTIQSTNYTSTAGWQINKAGTATFNDVALRGAINGGTYTGYAWPASGMGFHLGPNGLLLGNANAGKYLQFDVASGNLYAPQFSIVNGAATFSGNLSAASGSFSGSLTAQVVNTANIVGAAITNGYYASTSGSSVSITILGVSGGAGVSVQCYVGDPYAAYTGAGEGASLYTAIPQGSLYVGSGPLVTQQSGTLFYAFTGIFDQYYTFTINRNANSGTMIMIVTQFKR